MLEESITTFASPKVIWEIWKKSHRWEEGKKKGSSFHVGQKGKAFSEKGKKARFVISGISEGKSFSITWKSFLVRMVFTYRVEPYLEGSQITHQVRFKGLFGFFVRRVLGKKIRKSIRSSLQEFVSKVERSQY